jgi:hypothetical protein
LIRQAHPGPAAPAYRSFGQKAHDAERYVHEEGIEYPVAVDDLAGTTHQTYGGLADPTYVIDVDGRVAFYAMWTHAPTLHRALTALADRQYRGVVLGGVSRTPRPGATLTDGWIGLQRGLPQSAIELEMAAPGTAVMTWLGHRVRPLLAPLTLRATPHTPATRAALTIVGAAAVLAVARQWRSRHAWRRSAKGSTEIDGNARRDSERRGQ